jgi:superfamily II DNA or RNA helicase
MASEYFYHIGEWRVIMCRECQVAVWPDQVRSHLQNKQHRLNRKDAEGIQDDIQLWYGIENCRSNFTVPAFVRMPVERLPVYNDGQMCMLEPEKCQYICRSTQGIRIHLCNVHKWSARNTRGGSGTTKAQTVQHRREKAYRSVRCQRFFAQGPHSHYFEIRETDRPRQDEPEDGSTQGTWQRAWARADRRYNEIQAQETIAEGEKDEVNPWLRRTGWSAYLAGFEREDLLQSVREPDPDAEEESEQEPVEAVIWKAMEDVAVASQKTVKDSGIMVRMHAIRTEKEQVRYEPLQPYWNEKDVRRRCRPWQQMLMFFARTQRRHEWSSPPYRFNQRQHRAWEQLVAAAEQEVEEQEQEDVEENREEDVGDEESQPLKPVQRACLDFCIELMNQTVHRKEYDCALVCSMAVLGVNPFRSGWRDPESYPPIISSVLKIAHFMVVQKATELAGEDEEESEFSPCSSPCDFECDSGYGSQEERVLSPQPDPHPHRSRHTRSAIDSSPASPAGWSSPGYPGSHGHASSLKWVQTMMDSFMVRRTNSPIDWLLDLRAYGLKIHYNTTAPGHVMWKDKYELQYKDVSFTMSEFRGMVHQLVLETRRTLVEDLMFSQSVNEIPVIPWSALHDDPSNAHVGWSFIDDQRNRFPVDGPTWLSQRIQQDRRVCQRFVKPGTTSGISKERLTDYMRQVSHFRAQLLVLMHMTGGQPARGPEILSVRHRNTAQGGHRNLFIEDGLVVFVTRYSKQYMITGDVKIIHRYLPREVGELVVWFKWLVLPFVERMEAMVWRQDRVSSHLWPADVDGRKWTTDRMTDAMKQATSAGMGRAIGVAAYREIAIAISREWVRGATQFQRDEEDAPQEWDEEQALAHAADEQATHTPQIAGSIYARNSMERSGVNADRRLRFRMVSTDWHRFLQFESQRSQDQRDTKRKRCPFEDDADEEYARRQTRIKQMDAAAALKGMMKAEVSFRSVQGEAMRAIQDGVSPIVAVMPTGSGKSVLFMLPAWAESGGLTVVVVPLNGLRADMVHRCQRLGIRCAVWDDRRQPDGASIVLITPEKAVDEAFATYIRRSRETRRLDRIVVDECHTILNDQVDFRKRLQRLGELAAAETQMVLLTATLPPSEEERLFQRMYWQREEVRLIRASTVRPNIKYSVVKSSRRAPERAAHLDEMVSRFLEDPRHGQSKVLIMCNSRTGAEEVARRGSFPCEYYHAGMSNRAREEVLEDFRQGRFRVIAATGAFGMGIDIDDIHLVIHIDEPWDMLDYGQTSGRGGRDGGPTEAIIIRGGYASEDGLVRQYIDGPRPPCRRILIDRYLDGDHQRQQCQEGEQACDICEQAPADPVTPSEPGGFHLPQVEDTRIEIERHFPEAEEDSAITVREIQQHQQERRIPQIRRIEQEQTHSISEAEIQRCLERWKGVCAICRAHGRDFQHSINRCPEAQRNGAEEERKRWQNKGGIRYEWGIACYKCGLPPSMCSRSNDAGIIQKGGLCQFWGVVIGVVIGIKHGFPPIWQQWIHQQQRAGECLDEVSTIQWMGRRDEKMGCSRVLAAFVQMAQEVGYFESQRKGDKEASHFI